MKILLTQYASYHLWANQQLIETIVKQPKEVQELNVSSSFTSLKETLLHMWDAESIWWQRIKLQETITRPSESFTGSCADITTKLMHQSRQWQEWILHANEHMLEHEFIYYNTRKEKFKQATFQVLLHLFNHGTYHRGQLVNILRQLEVGNIPATDFIIWSRKKSII
ncbi:MAG TPA: DinB family protein [Flavisolibacter sp.]|nr:DinB family protein [Flavisolibacter sp.]